MLPGYFPLGFGSAVIFASDFDGKDGRAFEKVSASQFSDVKGSVRAERLAVREVHSESDIVWKSLAGICLLLVIIQTAMNFAAGATGHTAVR